MCLQSPILVAGGLALMSLFSAGCSAPEILNLGGRTALATGALYRQAESIVMARDREAAPQCKTRMVLGTRLLEAPEAIADPRGGVSRFHFQDPGPPLPTSFRRNGVIPNLSSDGFSNAATPKSSIG